MKKLLSVLLALVMVFSLTVPAFADGPDGPMPEPVAEDSTDWAKDSWAGICAAQPEETAQFLAEFDAWFAEEYPYYDSFEAYCEYWEESPEEAYCYLFGEWGYDPVAEWAALCAAQPEETAQFLAELPAWFAENYSYYASFDEYVEYCDGIEDAYMELFSMWNWEKEWAQKQQAAVNQFITDRGGVPGQINVMLNGQYIKFPDAVPELTDGRTMVPFRAIFESLGAEITFDGGKIHAVLGDTVLDLTIGSDTMTKTVNGKAETVKMDCAPYIKGGRTYVPVRFISEALGCEVGWDGDYRSAVIIDREALAEQIDKDFTIYNQLMAKSVLTDKTQKSVGSGRADVTLFDTLNGDKTGAGTYSYDLAASTAGASGKVEYDFSELWALIEGYLPMPLDLDGEEEYTQALELIKSLMKGSADVRVDLEKGKVYVSMPGLFEAMGSYLEESGVQIPKDAWLSASLGNEELRGVNGMLRQAPTIGSVLTTAVDLSGYNAVWTYDGIMDTAAQMAKLFGDGKFTRSGSANVLTMTKADLAALMEEDGYTGGDLDALSKFDLTLTIRDNGDMDVNYQARVALASSEINLGDFVDVSVKGSTRDGKSESTMELHIKNVLKATVTVEETVTETDTAPETTPPSDALVLPVDGTLPGSTITSPDGPTQPQI